ncbi:MAG: AtpZ/AtpI family protein [Terriglobales bacterium]
MPETPKKSHKQGTLVRGLKYTHIAFALPFGVIAGLLLGSLVDSWLGTTYMRLVGLGLGIIAGFYDLFRTMQRMNKESDGE